MTSIRWFETVGMADLAQVGGKNASLGEMIKELSSAGLRVPGGFALTTDAYRAHVSQKGIASQVDTLMGQVGPGDQAVIGRIGEQVRALICSVPLPDDVARELRGAYAQLEQRYGANCSVAMRSSATAEDLPEASFAGQQETFLNVVGADALVANCPAIFASLFTNRAIAYRLEHTIPNSSVALSIGVQKMVRSDLACSGVMFTLDTESGQPDVIFLTASYGLGEPIVQGAVNPDEFYVHKPTLAQGFRPILKKRLGSKETKLILASSSAVRPEGFAEQNVSKGQHERSVETTQLVPVPAADRARFSLTDDEILELGRAGLAIEQHYSALRGSWAPMDIEWAKDGGDGKLYIVQSRPETVHGSRARQAVMKVYRLAASGTPTSVLARGKSVGTAIVTGPACVVHTLEQASSIAAGAILVAPMTTPDWELAMRKAVGLVTDQGGRTCHAAIVSREMGIPAVVGTGDGTSRISDGQQITVDCSGGEDGLVYAGNVPFVAEEVAVDAQRPLPVKLMVNVGDPDVAFQVSMLPCDGVGLARLEFVIGTAIGIHPMAVLHPERITDAAVRAQIATRLSGVTDAKQWFIDTMAQELGTIVAAFAPRPVIARFSDFKTDEYRGLLGGTAFEPDEANPMLGMRGAARYTWEGYQEAFALECAAFAKIREVMGLKNLRAMVPFVRTVAEAQNVVAAIAKNGLTRGVDGFELYMMCEIPADVVLFDQFAKLFDGFSIGSNDLTQLTLGVDRNSAHLANLFDERDEAVKLMIAQLIAGAKKAGKPIGLCGQAPSDYPEMAQFLVSQGISSISVTPDRLLATRAALAKTGKRI